MLADSPINVFIHLTPLIIRSRYLPPASVMTMRITELTSSVGTPSALRTMQRHTNMNFCKAWIVTAMDMEFRRTEAYLVTRSNRILEAVHGKLDIIDVTEELS